MSTAATLITQIRRSLVDTDDEAYSENDLLSYINEAQVRFASETHCCQAEVAYTLTGNKATFAALKTALGATTAQKILSVGKVRVDDASGDYWLRRAPFHEMNSLQISTVTTPTRWSTFGESVYFDLDSSASPSLTTAIFCSYVPVDLDETTDSCGIPLQWEPAIVKYAEFCARVGDRDAGLANGAFNQYETIRLQATEYYKSLVEM